jgi:outer membrane protein OmpA-like peptidoglycan-associated protein
MRTSTGWLMIASLLLGRTVHAQDCALGQQYLARAQQSQGAASVPLLRESLAACPSYGAYEALGEQLARSRNRRDWTTASGAFVDAEQRAPTPQARAQTLYQYASLLNADGDPQNAYPMIKKAHALEPERRDIARLSADIEKQVQVPKKHQLVRSFGLSVYQPLKASATVRDPITGAGHRQVNIPINFEFDSVELNESTRQNVKLLAEALTEAVRSGKQFEFVGHSDARGDERYNVDLSRRRAETMRGEVIQLEPALAGHIGVDGVGSSDPIDPGTDLQAMQANRRLQVIVK